jgi:hypothetical protein
MRSDRLLELISHRNDGFDAAILDQIPLVRLEMQPAQRTTMRSSCM